jgi:hypothetical protein
MKRTFKLCEGECTEDLIDTDMYEFLLDYLCDYDKIGGYPKIKNSFTIKIEILQSNKGVKK